MNTLSKLLCEYYCYKIYIIKYFFYLHNIDFSWFIFFYTNFDLISKILLILEEEYKKKIIFPSYLSIFKVFTINIKSIKIIFLGQDPYINIDQAHGLSFSVPYNTKIPPSLNNIFKEINNEFPERNYIFKHGNLEKWLNNGIFLLNCSLTVIGHKSNSHYYIWNNFTEKLIYYLDNKCNNIIFLLLGNFAFNKSKLIKNNKYLTTSHPSPLSFNKGFCNSNIFKKCEELLNLNIDWNN